MRSPQAQKTSVAVSVAAEGRFAITDVCKTLKVARSNIAERVSVRPEQRRGRPPLPDDDLLASIRTVILDNPAWGYIRIWAHLRRLSRLEGRPVINRKRVYRVMKVHGLLLKPNRGDGVEERRHDGLIAVSQSNRRWCSDGFEIACDNAEKVRVAFALDCCDREAMAHVATTSGIKGEYIRDLMVTAVEHRFGRINRLTETIEWLTDNGSCYLAAETRHFARHIGLEPLRTPVSSPQSNGMAEAFVKTFKRDLVNVSDRPDAQTVLAQLQGWFDRYNRLHPHSALGYRSPREFIAEKTGDNVRSLGGDYRLDLTLVLACQQHSAYSVGRVEFASRLWDFLNSRRADVNST